LESNISTINGKENVTHDPVDSVLGTQDATHSAQDINVTQDKGKDNQATEETVFENVVITDVDGNATSNRECHGLPWGFPE